jgi:hypothetical protein
VDGQAGGRISPLSRDPIGDREAHNYEPLLAAPADAGMRPPGAR